MFVRQLLVLFSIAVFSTVAYAQKGLGKAVEMAVPRQVINRAKLPTFRDGVRNLVTRRLGNLPAIQRSGQAAVTQKLAYPTSSVLNFGTSLKVSPVYVTPQIPQIVGGRHDARTDEFYSVAAPGSGDIAAIALPAYALIKQAAIADGVALEDCRELLKWAEKMDAMSKEGNWDLIRDNSFNQLQYLVNQAYGQSGNIFSKGVLTALDVLAIQTWMLEHEGRFPQLQGKGREAALARSFESLMNDMSGNDPEFAQDPAVQGAIQHLVHLRATARGAMTPIRIIREVLERIERGGRIPGSSLERVSVEEDALTQELNFVEQLHRANLLYILLPMEQSRSVIDLYLRDFEKKGHIYQQMIKIIPEFAYDGETLNVPTYSHLTWKEALNNWKRAHNDVNPRATIAGRYGLPVNFNDLTPEEKTEVLLGTYLRIKDK
ncbi:MAG: hypothetical protein J6Q05_03835 [Elusimicrobiaceae bacterium]|nr:hypothetical protein [Elusimicrobiaceae bacterium]